MTPSTSCQINRAVADLDRAIQHNAGSAEEPASAAEEMSAQSLNLKGTVRDLVVLIHGSSDSFSREMLPEVP